MVVAGYNMTRGIFPDSAYVFNYKDAYGLSQDEVHYPYTTIRGFDGVIDDSISLKCLPNQRRKVCIGFSLNEGFCSSS